tara:strand:- start:1731 stop:1949 length:219 start_codon:yes stop_codon:yes gene_type:complete
MCLGGPPKPKPLPAPRPTAPPPEKTAKNVVTGTQRKTESSAGKQGQVRVRSGTESLRIRKPKGMVRGGNLNY